MTIGIVTAWATSKLFNSTVGTFRVSDRRQERAMQEVEEHDSQEEVLKESAAMSAEAQIESLSVRPRQLT